MWRLRSLSLLAVLALVTGCAVDSGPAYGPSYGYGYGSYAPQYGYYAPSYGYGYAPRYRYAPDYRHDRPRDWGYRAPPQPAPSGPGNFFTSRQYAREAPPAFRPSPPPAERPQPQPRRDREPSSFFNSAR
jgi:hypothetical protein